MQYTPEIVIKDMKELSAANDYVFRVLLVHPGFKLGTRDDEVIPIKSKGKDSEKWTDFALYPLTRFLYEEESAFEKIYDNILRGSVAVFISSCEHPENPFRIMSFLSGLHRYWCNSLKEKFSIKEENEIKSMFELDPLKTPLPVFVGRYDAKDGRDKITYGESKARWTLFWRPEGKDVFEKKQYDLKKDTSKKFCIEDLYSSLKLGEEMKSPKNAVEGFLNRTNENISYYPPLPEIMLLETDRDGWPVAFAIRFNGGAVVVQPGVLQAEIFLEKLRREIKIHPWTWNAIISADYKEKYHKYFKWQSKDYKTKKSVKHVIELLKLPEEKSIKPKSKSNKIVISVDEEKKEVTPLSFIRFLVLYYASLKEGYSYTLKDGVSIRRIGSDHKIVADNEFAPLSVINKSSSGSEQANIKNVIDECFEAVLGSGFKDSIKDLRGKYSKISGVRLEDPNNLLQEMSSFSFTVENSFPNEDFFSELKKIIG